MTDIVEIMARAMSAARNLSPDSLYQHNDYEDWPEDHRNEYICVITGKPMVAIFHRAWRHHEAAARAALAALAQADFAIVPVTPTEAMERDGGQEYAMTFQRPMMAEVNAKAIYRAMIDAGAKT